MRSKATFVFLIPAHTKNLNNVIIILCINSNLLKCQASEVRGRQLSLGELPTRGEAAPWMERNTADRMEQEMEFSAWVSLESRSCSSMGTIRKEETGAWDIEGDSGCQMFLHVVLKTMKGTETKSQKTGRP